MELSAEKSRRARWKAPKLPLLTLLLLILLRLPLLRSAVLTPVIGEQGCATGWFRCGENGTVCLEQRFFCDQKPHCPQGEDEQNDCLDFKGDTDLTKKIMKKPVLKYKDRHKCSLREYPSGCVCRLGTRLHCKGGFQQVPQDIDTSVTGLLLGNNAIQLNATSFSRYKDLKLLHLQGNNLTDLPDGVFSELHHLTRLFLNMNQLTDLQEKQLEGLTSLRHLYISDNAFTQFDHFMRNFPLLESLWMNHNLVTLANRPPESQQYDLAELFLENNLVEELTEDSLRGFTALQSLYLRENKIRVIYPGAFRNQTSLVDLDLSYNQIKHLYDDSFLGLTSLISLNLDWNPLVTVAAQTFSRLPSLASLHLLHIEFTTEALVNIKQSLNEGYNNTPDIHHVYFARFRYCGYLPRVLDCWPKTDGVSSFEHLLVRPELRVAVWMVALLTLLGNLTVLWGRVLNRDDNKVLSLFIRNLAVADMMTGLYLVVVAVKDLHFRSEYHEHAYYWMTSWQCTITGVLAMTSAEVSVLILSFMSVERWLCITWPLAAPKLSLGMAKIVLVSLWSLGFSLAIAPVMYYRSKQGFYGTNGMCFPLHLDDPWVPGWVYSAIVFVGINQIGVVLILVSYTGMFCSIRMTRANTPLTLGDREFALRFFFIVFTDCLCWTPIIILRILALASIEIPPELYAYVVVVLLPINSALNPFLYTFTTSKFRSRVTRFLSGKDVCQWVQRRDSDSEATRTSIFRSATGKWGNGRDIFHLNNGTTQNMDDMTVADVTKVPSTSRGLEAETKV